MRGRTNVLVLGWLFMLAAAQVAAFLTVRRCFVGTGHGQRLDTIALAGSGIGRSHVDGLATYVLDAVSVLSLLAAIIVIGFIALARGRSVLAAMATLLIVGANVTTQVLKYGYERPDLGVDPARALAGNSLPSGHTTVAASVAVALVLVLPPRLRGPAALAGAGYAALAGVATLSAGWHRPSDAVAAYLVVGAWAAAIGGVLAVVHRRDATRAQQPHRFALLTLVIAGFGLLVVAAVGVVSTNQVISTPPQWLGRGRLFVAYAGGAAGIAGTASVMMALVLSVVHRAVPVRGGGGSRGAARVTAGP